MTVEPGRRAAPRREAPRREAPRREAPRRDAPRRDPAADVAAAHEGISRTQTTFGPRPARRRPGLGDRVLGFTRRYGWRAYALPVLAVVTVVALMNANSPASGNNNAAGAPLSHVTASTRPVVAPSHIALKDDTPAGQIDAKVLKGYALPAGAPYTRRGKGTFRILKGHSAVVGSGPLHRYSIDVENGVNDIDLTQFQSLVERVLGDSRSWSGHGVSLQRVDSGPIDFHITLTSSLTVRTLCGYSIPVETSCYVTAGMVPAATVNRVVFNDARWVRGSTAYIGDLRTYRMYMINHEDGHALGHEHAHSCLPGGLAPAMMQQTFGLKSATTGKQCEANPWPYPPGVKGAPGKEALDTRHNDEYGLGD